MGVTQQTYWSFETALSFAMGLLGSIRKKTPLLRMKRKRPESLTLASTCEFSQDTTTSVMEIDDPEDTQELLSPKEREGSFDDRPIILSNEDEEANNDARREDTQEEDGMLYEERNYVSESSGDEADAEDDREKRQEFPPIRTHTRIRSDGQLMHIFHDELATLYEEPNKSDDSMTETGPIRTLDESNIRARWDYVLQLMVGQCDASLYDTIAEMIPGAMDVAEI